MIAAPDNRTRPAAGITVYRPDEAILQRLIAQLSADGVSVVLHVDGPAGEAIEPQFLAALQRDRRLTILHSGVNAGIGAGLNRLMDHARIEGFDRLLLLDQDSDAPVGLHASLSRSFDRLEAEGVRMAALGACPVVPQGEAGQPPRYRTRGPERRDTSLRFVDYVITSGSLVSLEAFGTLGPFRADYFIDAIDVEWCFRAWRRGYGIAVDQAIPFPHRIGAGTVRFGPLVFPRQSRRRMQTYVRNQAHLLRQPHIAPRWKLRTLLYLPAQVAIFLGTQRKGDRGVSGFVKAGLRGLSGRLGRPSDD